jgi:hypothetical protein
MYFRSSHLLSAAVVLSVGLISQTDPPGLTAHDPSGIESLEAAHQKARCYLDQIEVTKDRDADQNLRGVTLAELTERYKSARSRLDVLLASITPPDDPDDRRAFETIKRSWEDEPAHETAGDEGRLAALTNEVYRRFGEAAQHVEFDGKALDRLTIMGLLPRTENPRTRKALFMSMRGIWNSVNGDPGSVDSPYRRLVTLRVKEWEKEGTSPFLSKAKEFGIRPALMESWLISILAKWKSIAADPELEPWDFAYAAGKASRILSPRIPRANLEPLKDSYFRQLGASPAPLGVHFDLEPRPGKDPVSFTTFGRRNRFENDKWIQGEFWVFTSYRTGGLDNLSELLHETGHGIHLAGIRTRPAFEDWPDSDTFTEALADLAALEVYEPGWQKRYLGASVPLPDSLRAKYSSIVMDVAWALFEMRLHQQPRLNPDEVWTEITHHYLGIRPHPEISWWAVRGQLVDSPGYMMNYALGAILAAELRARTVELRRRAISEDDSTWYPWVAERLFRFGLEKPSHVVIEEFLGRPPSPRALLEDMSRAKQEGDRRWSDGSKVVLFRRGPGNNGRGDRLGAVREGEDR